MQQSVEQNKFLFNLFNRLLHIGHYSVGTYDQNFDFKIRRDDSEDDNSLSYALSQKPTKK